MKCAVRFLPPARARLQAKITLLRDYASTGPAPALRHVLLLQRSGDVGNSQRTLPRGFVDKGELFYTAVLRELNKKTGFKTLDSTMRQALKASQVFDHPLGSPRGRLITHGFYFNLGNVRMPEIKGADYAQEAKWVALDDLPKMEDQLFEDHAAILDRFVGVYR